MLSNLMEYIRHQIGLVYPQGNNNNNIASELATSKKFIWLNQ